MAKKQYANMHDQSVRSDLCTPQTWWFISMSCYIELPWNMLRRFAVLRYLRDLLKTDNHRDQT